MSNRLKKSEPRQPSLPVSVRITEGGSIRITLRRMKKQDDKNFIGTTASGTATDHLFITSLLIRESAAHSLLKELEQAIKDLNVANSTPYAA